MMENHEVERIASAMHVARPDWPARQIQTLIRDNLLHRPRRDVFVALAWVASEGNSHTPYRVLENGPWWRATATEGVTPTREPWDPNTMCGICGKSRHDCERNPHGDHQFESQIDTKRNRRDTEPQPIEEDPMLVYLERNPQ